MAKDQIGFSDHAGSGSSSSRSSRLWVNSGWCRGCTDDSARCRQDESYAGSQGSSASLFQIIRSRISIAVVLCLLLSCSTRLAHFCDSQNPHPSTLSASSPPLPSQSFLSIPSRLVTIAKTEGTAALFSGVVPRTMWISLGGAVFLGVYEAALGGLGGL